MEISRIAIGLLAKNGWNAEVFLRKRDVVCRIDIEEVLEAQVSNEWMAPLIVQVLHVLRYTELDAVIFTELNQSFLAINFQPFIDAIFVFWILD